VSCAKAIVDRVGRKLVVAVPIGIGKPNLLLNALYRLAENDRRLKMTIFTGLTLVRPAYRSSIEQRFVEPLLDRLFGSYPNLHYVDALRKGTLPPNIQVHEFFFQAGAWMSVLQAQQSYVSMNYTHVARHLAHLGINVMAQLVAPHPKEGTRRLSLSSNPDITLDLAPYIAARRKAGQPIAVAGEINANLPFMPGHAEVATADFDVLLSPKGKPYDLFAPPKEPVPLADYAMALHASTLIKDGGTLQIGIGSFADALAHILILRHTRNKDFRALLDALGVPESRVGALSPFKQGLYGCSEMLVDGFLHLKKAGILRRRVSGPARGGVSEINDALVHAGFFVGSQAFYRELREMSPADLDDICMTAISFTNALYGDEALKREHRRDARFINTGMTATLLGAVSSDQLEDGRVVSGVGGQQDFVVMSHELEGARSIIAVRGTSRRGGGLKSNIVWSYGNTTVPRQLRDIIVTEYGIADLRGKSDRDVIVAMLTVADSSAQPELMHAAIKPRKLERAFTLPSEHRNNWTERIRDALGPMRADGLLPLFPLGTEMTEAEQSLIAPLAMLKSGTLIDRLTVLLSGLNPRAPHPYHAAALDRMGLRKPKGVKERLIRAIVLGALRRAGAMS
jgi:acyl-CoA hydrolase